MKKQVKSVFAFLLAMALLLSNGTLTGFAATGTGESKGESLQSGQISLYQNGDLSAAYVEGMDYEQYAAPAAGTVEAAIYNGLKNFDSRINLESFHITVSQAELIVQQVINSNPDLFYVSNVFRCWYNTATNEATEYAPEYIAPQSQLEEMTTAFDAAVEKALSGIDAAMTQLEKALYLHDYIVKLNAYDHENFENNTIPNVSHSAYGPLVLNVSVCDGYSLAYSYLLQECGVNARLITSSSMAHAWNAVEIDGSWYFVDLTHDDPVCGYYNYENNGYVLSSVGDKYCLVEHVAFLSSEDLWRRTEYSDGCYTGWAQTDIKCNNKKYDNAVWKTNRNEYGYCDGYWYYLKEEYKKGDVNGDDAIDAKDALEVLKYSVGIGSADFNQAAGFVNDDETIDSKDALDILKISLNMITEIKTEDAAIMRTEDPAIAGDMYLSLAEYKDTWSFSNGSYWPGLYTNVSVYAPQKELFFNAGDKLYKIDLTDPAKTLNVYIDLADSQFAGIACIFGMIIVDDNLYFGVQNDPNSKHILFYEDFKEDSSES